MKLPSFLHTPPPQVALEIGPRRVVAVAVSGPADGGVEVTGWAVESLGDGVVVPSLTATNVVRPADLVAAIGRAWERIGHRPRRIALVLPDAVAKVSLVRFQQVPARRADLDELVKFQIRKAAPFRIEDAQVSYVPGASSPEGQEFVVVQARRDIIAEYEHACREAGASAGAVDLATMGVAHYVRATHGVVAGDWLLIHATPDAATLAIFRGEDLVFFRHRGADGDGHLGELVHQTAMYYQDRLGGQGFVRVLVAGTTAAGLAGGTWGEIQARLGVRAEAIDPSRGVRVDHPTPWTPLTMEAATPALGGALSQRVSS